MICYFPFEFTFIYACVSICWNTTSPSQHQKFLPSLPPEGVLKYLPLVSDVMPMTSQVGGDGDTPIYYLHYFPDCRPARKCSPVPYWSVFFGFCFLGILRVTYKAISIGVYFNKFISIILNGPDCLYRFLVHGSFVCLRFFPPICA